MMKVIEFKSKIQENRIMIPRRIQQELVVERDKNVRVVVFMEDYDLYDERVFRQEAKAQFLKGYADSDSIYDL